MQRGIGDYLAFSGQTEHPGPHEVIFADQAGHVHARRWTNRQSGLSAVQAPTSAVLIVTEAMHDSAPSDVPELMAAVAAEMNEIWSAAPVTAVLTPVRTTVHVRAVSAHERRVRARSRALR